jgi:hypothetical protein
LFHQWCVNEQLGEEKGCLRRGGGLGGVVAGRCILGEPIFQCTGSASQGIQRFGRFVAGRCIPCFLGGHGFCTNLCKEWALIALVERSDFSWCRVWHRAGQVVKGSVHGRWLAGNTSRLLLPCTLSLVALELPYAPQCPYALNESPPMRAPVWPVGPCSPRNLLGKKRNCRSAVPGFLEIRSSNHPRTGKAVIFTTTGRILFYNS